MYGRDIVPGKVFRTKIQRRNENEMDKAIADLEKRGFTLIKRGSESKEMNHWKATGYHGTPFRYEESETNSKVWAVLEKIG